MFHVSLEELADFAHKFWGYVKDQKVFAFHGEMGAGKTTIIAALCRHKRVIDTLSSPTFSIINEYCFTENGQARKIYHMDLYRLNSLEEIVAAGVEDCIYSGEICFVEWPEKAPQLLDEKTVHVFINVINATKRTVKVETTAASYI